VTVKAKVDREPPKNVKNAYYRITQEIFNNIAKHTEATFVDVQLESNIHHVAFTIKDNGIGFDFQAEKSTGMGISIMHERALEMDIQLEIVNQIENGTRIFLFWSELNDEI
jgi:signal transduction histidine kinase